MTCTKEMSAAPCWQRYSFPSWRNFLTINLGQKRALGGLALEPPTAKTCFLLDHYRPLFLNFRPSNTVEVKGWTPRLLGIGSNWATTTSIKTCLLLNKINIWHPKFWQAKMANYTIPSKNTEKFIFSSVGGEKLKKLRFQCNKKLNYIYETFIL